MGAVDGSWAVANDQSCLLYTSDAADERSSVDLGGRRIIKKKKTRSNIGDITQYTLRTHALHFVIHV